MSIYKKKKPTIKMTLVPRPVDENGVEKRSKFNNRKVIIDGITFDSTAEGRRYGYLKIFKQAGTIKDFEIQKEFTFTVNDVEVCKYRADFMVVLLDDTVIFEDVKGVITKEFSIKFKLMKAIYGIDVQLIKEASISSIPGTNFGMRKPGRPKTKPEKPPKARKRRKRKEYIFV